MVLGIVFLSILLFVITSALVFSGRFHYSGERIGVIRVTGIISSPDTYLKLLDMAQKDRTIKAVVVRVDSPGGVVGACQEIHDRIAELAKSKPVVVSMGSVAASGGLYISTPATKVLANPGTITGSIGVIIQGYTVKELMKKLGVDVFTVKSGKFKDILSPFKKPNDEETALLKALIDESYMQFVKAVAEDRNIPLKKVIEFADGRIFTGEKALKLGVVDELGGFAKALDVARQLADAPSAQPYELKLGKSLLQRIAGEEVSQLLHLLTRVINGQVEAYNLMYILH
jgi:protease-4